MGQRDLPTSCLMLRTWLHKQMLLMDEFAALLQWSGAHARAFTAFSQYRAGCGLSARVDRHTARILTRAAGAVCLCQAPPEQGLRESGRC
jgi:hypothetical protein